MYYQDIENKPKGSNLAHLFVAVDPSNLPTLPETQDVTTPQVWGPFYSAGAPFRAKLSPVGVTGKPLLIKGRVYAKDTRKPIPFAVLDLWQASHKGGEKGGHYDYHEEGPERRKYTEDENTVGKVKYTKDFNTVGKAKNFDFRGKALCNSSGEYEVETIIPAPYLDDEFEEPPGKKSHLFSLTFSRRSLEVPSHSLLCYVSRIHTPGNPDVLERAHRNPRRLSRRFRSQNRRHTGKRTSGNKTRHSVRGADIQ
jgi:protocatechuate 3,4-dioxygenase beta subunit